MPQNEKQLSERMLLDFLRRDDAFPPVRIRVIETETRGGKTNRIDAIVEATWNENQFRFAVATRLPFNPKVIQEAAGRITAIAKQLNVNPLIVTPYLSDEQLRALESQQVSGIDLSGNGLLIVPDRMIIYRTGNPNKYPGSSTIRNVYRGVSSLVARSFLLRPEYETMQELREELLARGGKVNLSTVSKVCSSLADDLIIERERQGRNTRLRLLQPDKLLDRLVENYVPPKQLQKFTGKLILDEKNFQEIVKGYRLATTSRVALTGASSSQLYATMAREPINRYYCTDLMDMLERLGEAARETDRFPNFELTETDDPTVYFDIRGNFDASPLQAYLELSHGDKRERETAEQIRQRILQDLNCSRSMP